MILGSKSICIEFIIIAGKNIERTRFESLEVKLLSIKFLYMIKYPTNISINKIKTCVKVLAKFIAISPRKLYIKILINVKNDTNMNINI